MIDKTIHKLNTDTEECTCFDDYHMDMNKPRIKDIFWNNLEWIEKLDDEGIARPCILDNIQRTLLCKTLYLGYDAFDCDKCDNWIWLYRHCHSRFCSSCGIKLQKTLAVKAEVMCVDIRHRHMVFTIPKEYREYFRTDREALNILFVASRNTLMKMFNKSLFDKVRRKRGYVSNIRDNYYLFRNYKDLNIFGEIATLHTFGRDLKWNPHIHALVPELIYDSKKDEIRQITHFNYESLRKTWQYEVNRLLIERFGKKKMQSLIDWSYRTKDNGFYVYAKADIKDDGKYINTNISNNVKGCVNYMMRYAGRPVMAESRILSYSKHNDNVSWFYEDHKTEEKITVNETGRKLLGKMIIHIPDEHFRMVRYYGFYNNKRNRVLDRINELLGTKRKREYANTRRRKRLLEIKLDKLKYRTSLIDSYNRDIFKCECSGTFKYTYTYNPLEGKHNDREYRRNCINEMRALRLRGRSSP